MQRPDNVLPSPVEVAPLPEVANHTPWPAQYFQHVDPHGDGFHVMVSRMTYTLRGMAPGAQGVPEPVLLPPDEQVPLCEADEFIGEPGRSSTVQESDYAPYKPLCDVLLVNAHAHSPNGEPATRWAVGLAFGDAFSKPLQVTGPRRYVRGVTTLGALRPEPPQPATRVPLCYEAAFGGPNLLEVEALLDAQVDDPTTDAARRDKAASARAMLPGHFLPNPVGCGRLPARWLQVDDGHVHDPPSPAPQIEAFEQPFSGQDDYPVVGYGPVGRWWQPRLARAGTHDEAWRRTQWPRSPLDHDYRYWNCAPDDQQVPYPEGGEVFRLVNLTPGGGTVRFALPRQPMRLLVRLQAGPLVFAPMNIDTVIVDVGRATLSVVRRALVGAGAGVRKLELGTWPADEPVLLQPPT